MRGTSWLLGLCVAVGACDGPRPEPSPDDLTRAGNLSLASDDPAAAVRHYAAAAERTPDPGLVAFNRAAALFALNDFRAAELDYRRALADDEIPPDRRARATYNLGVCLLRRGGEAAVYRSAIECFDRCNDSPAADPRLIADARHNLEVAKLLWDQAREREKARPRANDPPPNDLFQDEYPRRDEDGNWADTVPEGPGDVAGPTSRPDPSPDRGAGERTPRATDRRTPGVGNLPVVPDEDVLRPMTPEDTRAALRATDQRLEHERRTNARSRAGPEYPHVRDW